MFHRRREAAGVPVSLMARIRVAGSEGESAGNLVDLSKNGFFVYTGRPLPPGTKVRFEIDVPWMSGKLVGDGVVVRASSRRGPGGDLRPSGMGVEIVAMDTVRDNFIERMLSFPESEIGAVRRTIEFGRFVRDSLRGNRIGKREFARMASGGVTPVVMLHGFLGNRGMLVTLEGRLKQAGIPVISFDLGLANVGEITATAALVAGKLERLSERHGIERWDMLAHSMGGLIGLYYVKRLGGGRRVRRFVAIGTQFKGSWEARVAGPALGRFVPSLGQMRSGSSFLDNLHRDGLPTGVEFFSIFGRNDLVAPASECVLEDAHNIMVAGTHSALLVSPGVFRIVEGILDHRPAPDGAGREAPPEGGRGAMEQSTRQACRQGGDA